jgi:pimeloyl-ACP methyl ester carboxylesterase
LPTIKAGDISLEYFVEGSGPPLLLIMGFAGSAHSWGEPFLEELRRSFTVIRLSNRGTGESDKPGDQVTIRMMADDSVALLEALGVERSHVFGVSMGGMIAQEIAISHPQRANGLVLGCTWLGAPKAITADSATNAAMTPDPSMPVPDQIRKAWYALVSDEFVQTGHDFLEGMIADMMRWPTTLDTIVKQVVAIGGFSSIGRASGIASPTLVIHGDADRLMPPANGDNVVAEIPGAELQTIRGVGHMFFWEKPRESAAMITEFLSRVPAGAA